MEYLITPDQPTSWKINPVDCIENLEKYRHDKLNGFYFGAPI
jgi:hypothetical protein